jgi:hypothetical protein
MLAGTEERKEVATKYPTTFWCTPEYLLFDNFGVSVYNQIVKQPVVKRCHITAVRENQNRSID